MRGKSNVETLGFTVTVVAAFLFALAVGIIPTLQIISLRIQEAWNSTSDQIRMNQVVWYKRGYPCFQEVEATVALDEPILLSVEEFPHWFAPYYLAPRKFYYDTSEIRSRFAGSSPSPWLLKMGWSEGRLTCDLSRLSTTQPAEAEQ